MCGLGPARQGCLVVSWDQRESRRRKNNVSVGVPFSKNLECRLDQHQEVKQRFQLLIYHRSSHALGDMFDGRRAASGAVALRPTCHAGLNVMAKSIVAQKSFKITVVGQGVRTRPNQRHVASHNIAKLRQFVDTGGPKQPSNGCYSRVVTRRLDNVGTVLLDVMVRIFNMTKCLPLNPFRIAEKLLDLDYPV